MQDLGYELRRIPILGSRVNKGMRKGMRKCKRKAEVP
jgi:hypothetical protein